MKIAVLVSGGVDSSVALALLKEQGHELTAFYLKIWLEDELSHLGQCPWEDDLHYVRQVCDTLQIPLQIVSLQQEYWQQVVSYTVAELKAGRTPNPDILCNQRIKFGVFLDHIDDTYEKVASGHYAQTMINGQGDAILYCSPDAIKDQTYFLSHLSQQQLKRALFPIGHLVKEQVRALAHTYNLPNKDRKDSQGICFLGSFKFNDFVKHYLGESVGAIIELESNKIIGAHQGYWFYTIGQRQGLRLPGGPWYVVAKDIQRNTIYVSRTYHEADKMRNRFIMKEVSWITKQTQETQLDVKLRHGAHMHKAAITYLNNECIHVELHDRDQGIAPGQFAVLYNNQECLGSGVISQEIVE